MHREPRRNEQKRDTSAAERGLIVQRILVEGWTPAEAAQSLGIKERRVKRWLADYQRLGMASLRDDPAAETLPRRWMMWLRAHLTRLSAAARPDANPSAPAPCIELRHTGLPQSDAERRRL